MENAMQGLMMGEQLTITSLMNHGRTINGDSKIISFADRFSCMPCTSLRISGTRYWGREEIAGLPGVKEAIGGYWA